MHFYNVDTLLLVFLFIAFLGIQCLYWLSNKNLLCCLSNRRKYSIEKWSLEGFQEITVKAWCQRRTSSVPVLPYKVQKRFVAQSWHLKQIPILTNALLFLFFAILFLFCFFFSGKTVEQNQGSAAKTWMHRQGSQTMWVRLHHPAAAAEPGQQFHGSPNMNSLRRSWINEYSGNKTYGLLCHFENKYLVWTSSDHFNHLWRICLCYCVSTLLYYHCWGSPR